MHHPSSLSIRLTEPVVPLHTTSDLLQNSDMLPPPAIVRGLLTLKLAKPTKISSIDVELQAKATTRYPRGAGPSRVDVIEQYNVQSASTTLFQAGSAPQSAASVGPRVQFLDTRPSGVDSGTWLTEPHDLGTIGNGVPQQDQYSIDPAPPYPGQDDQYSFLGGDSDVAARSSSIASSSRITVPQSSPVLSRRSLTSDSPYSSPPPSEHSRRDFSVSRSIEEESEHDDESIDSLNSDNVTYYGLSRVATSSSGLSSEPDHRGRSHSRFSLGRIVHVFDAVKDRVRPRSRSVEQEERGRSLAKGKGKEQIGGVRHILPQIGHAEPSVADSANDESGDDSVLFSQGTYTYPIYFTIPSNSPPTMKTHHGSLIWRVKAEVKRPGIFKSKITAQREVTVVSLSEGAESEAIDLQKQWEDQLQYRVQIAGRGFAVGGKIPFQLTITPLAKVKVHSISVYLDEQTVYYAKSEPRVRSDAIRRATLLVIGQDTFGERHIQPILPLTSNDADTFSKSPLYRFLSPGEDASEVAASFMGPGPWTIRHQLRVPDSCSVLHPSNQTKGSNIMVNHTLKMTLRVEREAETGATGRRQLYDIVVHIPVQILSCHCTSDWMSLPRYDELPDPADHKTMCPCHSRHQARAQTHSHDTLPSESFASRAQLHERLISGFMSERGEQPPAYEH